MQPITLSILPISVDSLDFFNRNEKQKLERRSVHPDSTRKVYKICVSRLKTPNFGACRFHSGLQTYIGAEGRVIHGAISEAR